jgi:hypothetical protein
MYLKAILKPYAKRRAGDAKKIPTRIRKEQFQLLKSQQAVVLTAIITVENKLCLQSCSEFLRQRNRQAKLT